MRRFSFFLVFCCLFTGFVLSPRVWAGPVKLSPELVSGGDVMSRFVLASDSSRVVFLADQETDELIELFSVPIDGGSAVKLNSELVPGGVVCQVFRLSSDSSRVVYRAVQDTSGVYELYSVPIDGGEAVKLNSPLTSGCLVFEHKVSPDSRRVVYRADQDTQGVYELYSVPIDGGTPVKLNAELVAGGHVSQTFLPSPDSSRVVYLADQDTDDVSELYSVPIEGGTPVRLNSGLPAGGEVTWAFRVSGDSRRVVYVADQDTEGVFELYSVPLEGGAAVKLNSELPAGGEVTRTFRISADSSRVVYAADQDTKDILELYSIPIEGGTPVKLNSELPAGADVYRFFRLSDDGRHVVYRVDQETENVDELYSVPIAGGTPVRLNSALAPGRQVLDFHLSDDSRRVVYLADQETEGVYELFSVPISGGTPVRLNADLPAGGDVRLSFKLSGDGSRVVYRADQETNDLVELYSRRVAPRLYYPHIAAASPWTTEIAVVNTHGTEDLNGTLRAYDDAGALVSEGEKISLAPHGRRQINVGAYFPGATYAVLTADRFERMCGYTKFAHSGGKRVAVPALDTISRGNIYIPHVASNDSWWTGLSLVNTTPLSRSLTISCSDGTSFTRTLEPFGHQAFNFAEALGSPRPGVVSAEIADASGVIGLELFGHKKMPQLSGVLLRDQAAENLYFPHVASNATWWTGICAYNPASTAAELDITAYSDSGEILSTAGRSLPPAGKYIGPFRDLALDDDSAWFEVEASSPITGFELFGTNNGKMLAGYTAVNIKGSSGVFPKLEEAGWTGIAFVNPGGSTAVVTLRAYNEGGTLIAEEPITVCKNCREVDNPEKFFMDDISAATYLTYSSSEPVVAFQLNGSSEGMMLDGLPGM